MEDLLDRFFEDMDYFDGFVNHGFQDYFVKVSELNKSFFVLVKRPRGKIYGIRRK